MATLDCYSDPPIPTGCFYYLGSHGFCEIYEGIGYARIEYTFRGRPGLFAPVNTFSNIFYCIAGIYIYKKVFSKKLLEMVDFVQYWPLMMFISVMTFLEGFMSGLYHGSMWHGFQILDQYGMNMIITLLVLLTGLVQIKKYEIFCYAFILLYQFYVVLCIALPFNDQGDLEFQGTTIETNIPSFRFLFPLMLLFLLNGWIFYTSRQKIFNTMLFSDNKTSFKDNIMSLMWRILLSMGLGLFMSRLDEMYCTKITVYLLPLFWWHVLSAYAIIIQCTIIRCCISEQSNQTNFLLKFKYFIFPEFIKI